MFHDAVLELAKTEPASNGVVKTLDDICRLYGCWAIEENAAHFLKYKYFSGMQMDIITAEVRRRGCKSGCLGCQADGLSRHRLLACAPNSARAPSCSPIALASRTTL